MERAPSPAPIDNRPLRSVFFMNNMCLFLRHRGQPCSNRLIAYNKEQMGKMIIKYPHCSMIDIIKDTQAIIFKVSRLLSELF